jgi:hypothetical protein
MITSWSGKGRQVTAGNSDTEVTELVYRHQPRPVIQDGAKAMDAIFRYAANPG